MRILLSLCACPLFVVGLACGGDDGTAPTPATGGIELHCPLGPAGWVVTVTDVWGDHRTVTASADQTIIIANLRPWDGPDNMDT